jgi:hypothetical protein
MDPISAYVAQSAASMRNIALAVEIDTALTSKALDEMAMQASSIIDSVPPPPPMRAGAGGALDCYA